MAKIVKLSKPLKIAGKETNEITVDFDKITGTEMLAAEREARAMGDDTPSVFLSMRYQAVLAAKVIGVLPDDLMAMPATDFKKVVLPVANFLLDPA